MMMDRLRICIDLDGTIYVFIKMGKVMLTLNPCLVQKKKLMNSENMATLLLFTPRNMQTQGYNVGKVLRVLV